MSMYSLSKSKTLKKLKMGLFRQKGRNTSGRITVYHRGGGYNQVFRVIDYKRYFWNLPGIVLRLEYNPNRNMVLALISYSNGVLSYVPCSEKLRVGTIIRNKTFFDPSNFGCASYLKTMPVGTFIHCLELKQFFGAQLLRSYGAYARVMSKTTKQVFVKLRSGVIRGFCPWNIATIGVLLPPLFRQKIHLRAGFFRNRGYRPAVRGVAMNPVDHPHGGGEGKSAAGRPSVSRWGWLTKNVKKKV